MSVIEPALKPFAILALYTCTVHTNTYSVVSRLARRYSGRSRGLNPDRDKIIITLKCPDLFWGPHRFISNGYWELFAAAWK